MEGYKPFFGVSMKDPFSGFATEQDQILGCFFCFPMILIRVEFGGGAKFLEFYVPHKSCFIAFLRKNFRKFSNLEFYVKQIFSKNFPKFLKNFLKIFNFFKIERKYYFCTQINSKYYIDENLVKFCHKTPKRPIFHKKP